MSEFDQDFPENDELKEQVPDEESEKESDEEVSDARKTFFQALKELKDNINQESEMNPPDDLNIPSDPTGLPFDDGSDEEKDSQTDKVFASKSQNSGEDDDLLIPGKRNLDTADNIKMIMKVLDGNFQRKHSPEVIPPRGCPKDLEKNVRL